MSKNYPYIQLVQFYQNKKLKVLLWLQENENGIISQSIELFCEQKYEKELTQELSVLTPFPFEPIDKWYFRNKLKEWAENNEIQGYTVVSPMQNDTVNKTMIKKRIIEQENDEMVRLKIKWQENITH